MLKLISKELKDFKDRTRREQNKYLQESIEILKFKHKSKRKLKKQYNLKSKALKVRHNMDMIIAMDERLHMLMEMQENGNV